MADVETKLSAARTRLILDRPFLGALVLRLPMVAADASWCPKTATDARAFYYNPAYIDRLSVDQAEFILSHEALHCALSHFARRQHRVKLRWDLACDFAVNPLLIREGLTPTPEALYLEEYAGMTAEEIYPCLEEDENRQTEDQHLYDADSEGGQGSGASGARREGAEAKSGKKQEPGEGPESERRSEGSGAGRPQPLSAEERERLAVQWRQRLAGAAQQALQAGKLSGGMARLVDHLLQPQLPWRALLARHLTATARDDYNWTRPSRREGSAILPSLRSHEVNVVVAVDSSGSISPAEMGEFLAEVDALKGQVRSRITLHACDAQLAEGGPWVFEPWESVRLPQEIRGGGGTDFRPVFDWVARTDRPPDLLIYFTDADGSFPERPPPYPVVWLVKGRGAVPWGERVQLN